jgi:hypothetical protein
MKKKRGLDKSIRCRVLLTKSAVSGTKETIMYIPHRVIVNELGVTVVHVDVDKQEV